MPSDAQKPHVGCLLSHLVLRARQTWQAFRLLLRGYRGSDGGCCWRGRFRPVWAAAGLVGGAD